MTTSGAEAVPGLRYVRDYLSPEAHDRLLAAVDEDEWIRMGDRRMQLHGWTYDALSRRMARLGPLPDWAADAAERLHQEGLTPFVADQLIVNEYLPGQGIVPHVDLAVFDDTIVAVSCGSSCVIEFGEVESGALASVLLHPGSALIISGEARHRWRHHIPPRPEDRWHGMTLPRSRRVSLTFRRVLPDHPLAGPRPIT